MSYFEIIVGSDYAYHVVFVFGFGISVLSTVLKARCPPGYEVFVDLLTSFESPASTFFASDLIEFRPSCYSMSLITSYEG